MPARNNLSGKAAIRFLENLLQEGRPATSDRAMAGACLAKGLVTRRSDGSLALTAAGRHLLTQQRSPNEPDIGTFRSQHMQLSTRMVSTEDGVERVRVNESESPLAWLARRKGRDGHPMIGRIQFVAGERLRGDFTRAQLTPRITSSWSPVSGRHGGGGGAGEMTDTIIAARQRFNQALKTVGPEFAGILTDVCCFLRGLEDVEKQRGWPSRSAKVVLQLGLDRLARHYGLSESATETDQRDIQTWLAQGVVFSTTIER
jgi:hypothetical protein